jgi:hypothetical protein
VLTVDVCLPPEATQNEDDVEDVDVEFVQPVPGPVQSHVQGHGQGQGQSGVQAAGQGGSGSIGLTDIEDMGQAMQVEEHDLERTEIMQQEGDGAQAIDTMPALLVAIRAPSPPLALSIDFPIGICRVVHVSDFQCDASDGYKLRAFLCDPVYHVELNGREMEEEEWEGADFALDLTRGLWAQVEGSVVQACFNGLPASTLAALVYRRNAPVSDDVRKAARERVQKLADDLLNYAGRVQLHVQGDQCKVTALPDFVAV